MTDKDPINSIEFAKKLLEMTEASWVDADAFESFVKMAGIEPGKQKVDFCQRFIAMIKRLPDKLVDMEHRRKLVEAGQEYLEQAIQEEDELENQNPK